MKPIQVMLAAGLAALVWAATAGAQTSKILPVVPESGPLQGETLYTNSHALIIGINRYPHLAPDKQLACAERDATELREVLISQYAFAPENVQLLLSAQATRQGIEDALVGLTNTRRVGKDDRVLVFFSGHGSAVTLGNGSKLGFLIPADAEVELQQPNPADYLRTCVSMKSVWEKLEACPAKHVLLVADACFSGLLVRGRNPRAGDLALNAAAIREWLARPAVQVLTAGGREQEAKEDPGKGHGFFTLKLLEELRAKAANPGNAFPAALLAARLQVSVPNLAPGQLPQFDNYGGTEGQFVLIPTRPVAVPPLEQPAPKPSVEAKRPAPSRPSLPFETAVTAPSRQHRVVKTRVNPVDGAVMVWVPAGEFRMGNEEASDASPVHRVKLTRGFWLYRTEVTNGMYAKFLAANPKHPKPIYQSNPRFNQPQQPVIGVGWQDAAAYCKWAGARLPTEAEWEYAAGGADGRKYPWGNQEPDASRAVFGQNSNSGGPGPAGGLPGGASWCGALDLAGNVGEWCADWYDAQYYQVAKGIDPRGPATGSARVIRGGAWHHQPVALRVWGRLWSEPGVGSYYVGFRPARIE